MSEATEPIAEAVGEGKDLFDAPALFYLTHAEAIRRWGELAKVARSATCEFLESVGEDLDAEVDSTIWQMSVEDTGRGYRHFLWTPPGTPTAGDGTPWIALCFGWRATKVRITPHTYTPFVGVRVPQGGAHDLIREWGLPRDPVTSDLWCREVPLEGCSPCPSPIPVSSART